MIRLVLIRHGETDWNREGRWQGQTDVPLNATGRRQAQGAAEAMRAAPPEAIYTSDLARARQTAEAVAEATGAPLLLDPRLREIDLGAWEGMLADDIRSHDGARVDLFLHDPHARAGLRGETVAEVFQRVTSALDEILSRHPGCRVAVVSHGLALAALKTRILGLPLAAVWAQEPASAIPEEYDLEAK
ncbi:MAG TPA: histidine phosphatase family protein [Anaerolineales bacterium]|nr:histidine phosphatase family protein [Anaerolineales bacterium]